MSDKSKELFLDTLKKIYELKNSASDVLDGEELQMLEQIQSNVKLLFALSRGE